MLTMSAMPRRVELIRSTIALSFASRATIQSMRAGITDMAKFRAESAISISMQDKRRRLGGAALPSRVCELRVGPSSKVEDCAAA